MSIEENTKARRAAEEAMAFVREVEQEFRCSAPNANVRRFWELVWAQIAGVLSRMIPQGKTQICSGKMPDVVAKRFGHELMPFGEFTGKRVDDVPLERLQWYADQTFTDDLRKYLQSDRIQREDS